MNLDALFVLFGAGTVFLIAEYVRRSRGYGNETLRKLVHVLHAVTLALLVYVAPDLMIVALEILFLISVIAARSLHAHHVRFVAVSYLSQLYKVGRKTYGDILFPIGVIIALVVAEEPWVFAAAVLVLGLADTMATFIGKIYGLRTRFDVFGQQKSLVGSLAFFVTTVLIVSLFAVHNYDGPNESLVTMIFGLSLLLTTVESTSVFGVDNLLIPVIAVASLNIFI